MFPNPTQAITEVHYDYDNGNAPTTLIIYNEAGYVVRKELLSNARSKKAKVDVSTLPKGIYFISLINSKSYSQVVKLVVN